MPNIQWNIIGIILISAAITFTLRALPFFIFRGNRTMPVWLSRLGTMLPSAIMAVLIVYCLKEVPQTITGTGIFQCLAVVVVAVTYKWKHNMFLSILSGTLFYMILLKL